MSVARPFYFSLLLVRVHVCDSRFFLRCPPCLSLCPSARGDLTRLLGMRTVAFLGLVSEINTDVALSTKANVVGGICFSKAMFWDSKYHVREGR